MSTFRGGPADEVTLMFTRGPEFLRVVVDDSDAAETGHPAFDVLDMLDDEPRDGEEVHVYRRIGVSRPAHVNWRGTPGKRSGWYEFADYEYVPLPDDVRASLRDTEAWRAWALAQPEATAHA